MQNKVYELGIDEAGRGPVLGPLVYAIAFWEAGKGDYFKKKYKLRDSKVIKESERDSIFGFMVNNEEIGHFTRNLMPDFLSSEMMRRDKISLNKLSEEAVYSLIQEVLKSGKIVSHVYVDTLGDPATYKKKLSSEFRNLDFTVEKKADDLFPVVSAASVFAKVTRDKLLKEWNLTENFVKDKITDFGSGYPGDPKTKNWLKSSFDPVFGFPNLVRFSWKTSSNFLGENGGATFVWEDYEDEELKINTLRKPTKYLFADDWNVKVNGVDL